MVNKKYVLGFTILVLILGFIINVVGIQNDPSGNQSSVSNYSGESRNFSITIAPTVNNTVKWYVDGVLNGSTENNQTSSYRILTENAGLHNITVISINSSNVSDTDFTRWMWNVTDAATSETAPTITTPTAYPLDTSANISFTVNQSNAHTKVQYGTSSTLDDRVWDNVTISNYRNMTLTGLLPGKQYFFNVSAYNNTNLSLKTNSTTYNFTTLDPTEPNISEVKNDTATTSKVNITFTLNQSDAYAWVKYGTTVSLDNGPIGNNTSSLSRTIPITTGLDPATKYYYKVYARNKINQTLESNSTIQNFTTKPLGPTITNQTPTSITITAGDSTILIVKIGNQNGTLSWYEDNSKTLLNSSPVNPNDTPNYTFIRNTQKTYKITANISNDNGSDTVEFTINNRPTTFSTGNRIWDGSKPDEFDLTYSWTPQSFSGFYYNAKDNVGTENITIVMKSNTSTSIEKNKLTYSTTPQDVSFTYSNFGYYQVIGFMAEKYFAGYTNKTKPSNTKPSTNFDGISTVAQNQLHKVLIDDEIKRTISVGGTIALKEGYVLKAKDIDLNARQMLLSLLKDGNEVDASPLSAGETYVYTKTVGDVDSLPLIIVRFDSVFSGQETQAAFLKGMFQVSEDATQVETGNQFGNMEVTSASEDGIRMENSGSIGLSKGTTASIMGDMKIIVANNASVVRFALSVEKTGDFEVRSTAYLNSTPIMKWTPYNFGMNIGKTSVGFYYDLDDGVGNETLRLLNNVSGRSIPDQGLEYSTTPQEVKFIYTGFGKYQVIGFMADKYFAGYTSNTDPPDPTTSLSEISTLANNNLHKVLIDDDTKRTISVGGTIALKEGYVLKATDIDLKGRTMLLSLLKDGSEVDTTPLSAGQTYVYAKKVGSTDNLPLIMVRFETVFSGEEVQAAFLKGMFQISEDPKIVESGDKFGKMDVTSVTKNEITMSNDGTIGLDKNKNDVLMGNLKLKVADNEALRFYFAVDVTADMIENQLLIDAPAKAMAGDNLNIKVTAGGKAAENASLTLDTDMGTTDVNGSLNYSIPKTLKNGTYTITATKTGYEKATKTIEIEKYVDYRLSIEAPSNANQYETIKIKVLYNGTAMSGASVIFDNISVGSTDINGEVSYRLETSGTHSITASKQSYIMVSRDIDIRAPYSEFKSLDINITPNPVFTGEDFVVKSNITNVGTKSDTIPVDLIINGSAVDNRSVTLAAGEKVEINFTRNEEMAANITVDILGQSNLLIVQQKPTNYLVIAAIATGIGAVIIYVLTSKGLLSLEILKQKFGLLTQKFNLLFKK